LPGREAATLPHAARDSAARKGGLSFPNSVRTAPPADTRLRRGARTGGPLDA